MNAIVSTRQALKMTQQQLADALGVDHSTLWRMEKGKATIDTRTALALKALRAGLVS